VEVTEIKVKECFLKQIISLLYCVIRKVIDIFHLTIAAI